MTRRVIAAGLACLGALAAGCSSDAISDPADATTCAELVDASVAVAEAVLDRLAGQTFDELEAANPGQPFQPIDELLRADEFESRAAGLGCSDAELVDCDEFAGLADLAEGEVAEAFLAPYFDACD